MVRSPVRMIRGLVLRQYLLADRQLGPLRKLLGKQAPHEFLVGFDLVGVQLGHGRPCERVGTRLSNDLRCAHGDDI
jgi:hypothetical protein